MIYENLIHFIIEERERQGYSARQFSELIGTSHVDLRRIEKMDRIADEETISKMCKALGCEVRVIPTQYTIMKK